LNVSSLSIVYGFVKLVVHTFELKIAHAYLYGKTINGRVGIAAGDIRKPTSAPCSSASFAVPWVL
jgi:hypothetical protein